MTTFRKPYGQPHEDPLDAEVHPFAPRADTQRWRCPQGCTEPRVIFTVEVTHVEDIYLPMIDADLDPTYANSVFKKKLKDRPLRFEVVDGPVCRKCRSPVHREGTCATCRRTLQALVGYIPPPDFDPDVDDPNRPNACERCLELHDPVPTPPPSPPAPEIAAETYERRIRKAAGRPGLRKALLKAARRDHPDDPRWREFR